MTGPDHLEVEGFLTNENTPWDQNAVELSKETVLMLSRRHVVKYREARRSCKSCVLQSRLGGVGDDNFDVRAYKTLGQRLP
jgi:hypothetical protein